MNASPALEPHRVAPGRSITNVTRSEHLIVRVNDLLYAIPLDAFEQVAVGTFQTEAIGELPAWRGTATWNGTTLPALDLHRLLDPACTLALAPPSTTSRLVIFPVAGFRCALLVDACVGSFGLSQIDGLLLNRTRLLTEPLAGCGEVFQWRDELVVRIRPAELIRPATLTRLRTRLAQVDPRIALSADGHARAARLQQEEQGLEFDWSPEVCRDLARQYRDLGLTPDAQRLERLAAAPGGSAVPSSGRWLEGKLDGHGLVQALQVISLRRLSGELSVSSTGNEARFFFDSGRPVWANASALTGTAALDAAARWTAGRYRFTEQSVRNITGNLDGAPETVAWIQRLLEASSARSLFRPTP